METKPSAMDETLKKLEEGVKTLFTSEGYQKYLKTMAKFSSYSFNNTVLIASQRPDATLVAGYRAWQTKFGRQVKRGEKGIKIITPMKVTETKEVTLVDPLTHKIKRDADGRPMKELRDVTIPRFRVTTVFDISQTEGKELPVPEVHPLTASVPGYEDMLEAICRYSPVPITIEPVEGTDVNGFYHHVDKRIAVKEGLSQAQTIKTALHEVTHALLHDRDKLKQEGIQKDPHAREVEAESVAYTVSQAFGLDTSGYTFGYVASWSRSMELKELKQAMDIIRRTSAGMIDGIRGHLNDLRLEHLMEEPDLAVRVDAVLRENDYYGYTDGVEDPEENIASLRDSIEKGRTGDIREYLEEVAKREDRPALAALAGKTLQDLPEPAPLDQQLGQIRFYAAENMALPVAGQYLETLSLQDARQAYESMPENGRRGIGAILYDGAVQRDVPLLVGGRLQEHILENGLFQKDGNLKNAFRELDRMMHPVPARNIPEHTIGKGEISR